MRIRFAFFATEKSSILFWLHFVSAEIAIGDSRIVGLFC